MTKKDMTPFVVKAQAGDRQALNDLMGECYETLYYYAYKTVNDADLAGDITQESCIEIMQTLNNLRNPGAFRTWAGRIVYHQCIKHFKQGNEVPLEENEDGETILDQLPDENRGSVPELVQEDKEFQKTIMDMVNQLPEVQRSALMFYYYENLSVSQIAQIQDTTEGTVKSRLNYGRKAVKREVEEYEKKHNVRLHSVAPLPLLLYFLFGKDAAQTTQAAAEAMTAACNHMAATAGTTAVATATGATATTGAVITGISTKIVAIAIAAVVGIGAVIGAVLLSNPTKEKNTETTTQTEPENTVQTEPEETPVAINHGTMEQWSAFFGTWFGGVEHSTILDFSEGTMKITDRTFTWELEDCYYGENEAGVYLAGDNGQYFNVHFMLQQDGRWNAEVVELLPTDDPDIWAVPDDGEYYYAYRPGDYEGYTLVMLTRENALDYISAAPSTYEFCEDELFSGLMEIGHDGFREGLGSASYCKIVLINRVSQYWATPEEAVAGTQLPVDEVFLSMDDFLHPREYYSNRSHQGGGINLNNLKDGKLQLFNEEMIGVLLCQGYVLVPDDYQIPQRTADPDAAWIDEIWGSWAPVPDFASASPEGVTVNGDGTIVINGITGKIQHFFYYPAEDGRTETISLDVSWEYPEQLQIVEGSLEFYRHADGQFALQYLTEHPDDPDSFTCSTFYKPEKYQKVTLTAENFFEYVDCISGIQYLEDQDENGNVVTYGVQIGTAFRFKDGVGIASYVRGTAVGTCTTYETSLDANGAVISQQQVGQQQGEVWINIAALFLTHNGDQFVKYYAVGEELPATVTWESWSDLQITDFFGEIYIPV